MRFFGWLNRRAVPASKRCASGFYRVTLDPESFEFYDSTLTTNQKAGTIPWQRTRKTNALIRLAIARLRKTANTVASIAKRLRNHT